MRAQLCRFLLFLFPALTWGHAQEHSLVIQQTEKEIRRTAFLLGVAPDRVREARPLLREVTELGLQVADTRDIEPLVRSWPRVDRPSAETHLRSILSQLRRRVALATDSDARRQLTRNAVATLDALREIRPELGDELLEGFPEPPVPAEGSSRAKRPASRFAKSAEMEDWRLNERRLQEQIRQDVDISLERLRELEKDGAPSFAARAAALSEFFLQSRFEDAHALVDDTLELLAESPPSRQSLEGMRSILQAYGPHGDPERTEALLRTWSGLFEAVGETRAVVGHRFPAEGVDFTRDEYNILLGIQSLGRTPELALRALDYFPELRGKIEEVGGLDAFFLARGRPDQGWRSSPVATDAGPTDRGDEIEQAVRTRVRTAQRGQPSIPEQRLQSLEESADLLFSLRDPVTEFSIFPNLLPLFFDLEGELRPQLRRKGLAYIAYFRKPGSVTREDYYRSPYLHRLELVEKTIYAMWYRSETAAGADLSARGLRCRTIQSRHFAASGFAVNSTLPAQLGGEMGGRRGLERVTEVARSTRRD